MKSKRGRPRHLAQAVYTQKRRSQGASQNQIAEELSTISPQEHNLEKRQVRRWEKEALKELKGREVAKVFAWAQGFHGWTKAHEAGRQEFRVLFRLDGEGNATYQEIFLDGVTPWKDLIIRVPGISEGTTN